MTVGESHVCSTLPLSRPLVGPVPFEVGNHGSQIQGRFRRSGREPSTLTKPQAHKVRISASLIGKYEVTHEMFRKAQLPNPSRWQDNPNKPVERVRWRDAKQYCNERSLLEGLKPRSEERRVGKEC